MDKRKLIFMKNINRLIKKRGITRPKLADSINVPYSTVVNWTMAHRYPNLKNMEKLCNYFHVSQAQLVEPPHKTPSNVEPITKMTKIPVIGEIHCSEPIDARQNIVDYIPLPSSILHKGSRYFILVCEGHSMEPQIKDHSYVLCQRTTEPINNSIEAVVFMHSDTTGASCMLKRVHIINRNLIFLLADNRDYSNTDRHLTPENDHGARIVGVVKFVLYRPR